MEMLFVIPVVFIMAFLIWLGARRQDEPRIRRYLEDRGCALLEATYAPYGPGWFGERNERIYHVRYRDRDGNEHDAFCKTSGWTGVFFTEDRIIAFADHDEPPAAPAGPRSVSELEAENRRLREELQRIRRKPGDS